MFSGENAEEAPKKIIWPLAAINEIGWKGHDDPVQILNDEHGEKRRIVFVQIWGVFGKLSSHEAHRKSNLGK